MTKPHRFQEVDTSRAAFKYKGRALLAWHPGLGKSFGAMLTLKKMRALRRGPIVVLCPAIAKKTWEREWLKHFGRKAVVLHGRTPRRLRRYAKKIYILNYDILGSHINSAGPSWVKEIKRIKPVALIPDEIHLLKNPASQRSKAVGYLAPGIPIRIGLSGTPAPNRPAELWHPLAIINPKIFPSQWYYEYWYCRAIAGDFGNTDATGASNLDELYRKLTHRTKGVMLRRRKEDVLKDLPKKQNIIVPFELTTKQMKEYRHARDHFIGWLKQRDAHKALKAMQNEMFLKVGYLKRMIAEFKLPQIIDWIGNFLESGEKLLFFGIHHRILEPVFEKFKRRAVIITGKTSERNRTIATDAFNKNRKIDLMVGNIQAAGTAWSCRSSSNVAFCELSWVPIDHSQAADRCHGINRGIKGMPLNIYYLLAENTIEEKGCERLQKKAETIAAMIDGKRSPGDMNLHETRLMMLRKTIMDMKRERLKEKLR